VNDILVPARSPEPQLDLFHETREYQEDPLQDHPRAGSAKDFPVQSHRIPGLHPGSPVGCEQEGGKQDGAQVQGDLLETSDPLAHEHVVSRMVALLVLQTLGVPDKRFRLPPCSIGLGLRIAPDGGDGHVEDAMAAALVLPPECFFQQVGLFLWINDVRVVPVQFSRAMVEAKVDVLEPSLPGEPCIQAGAWVGCVVHELGHVGTETDDPLDVFPDGRLVVVVKEKDAGCYHRDAIFLELSYQFADVYVPKLRMGVGP
jgi:hypothetical protein